MDPNALKASVKCRQCGKVIDVDPNPYRPFCSDRCRKVDLGKWFSESYRVPTGDKGYHENETDQGSEKDQNES